MTDKNDRKKTEKITDFTIYTSWLIIIIILLLLNNYSLQTLFKFCQIVLLFIFLLEVEVVWSNNILSKLVCCSWKWISKERYSINRPRPVSKITLSLKIWRTCLLFEPIFEIVCVVCGGRGGGGVGAPHVPYQKTLKNSFIKNRIKHKNKGPP